MAESAVLKKDDTETLIVRETRLDDFDALMELNPDVYQGLDQHPYLFHWYMSQPNRHCYVLCRADDNRIIGLEVHFVSEDGITCDLQAGRFAPEYIGKNHIVRLNGEGMKHTKACHPPLNRLVWTAFKSPAAISPRGDHIHLIMERNVCCYKTSATRLQEIIDQDFLTSNGIRFNLHNVKHLTMDQAKHIMKNKSNQAFLFPHGTFIAYWEPYRLQDTSIDYILTTGVNCYYSEDKGQPTGFSIGKDLQTHKGVRYDLDFYGKNKDILISHVIKHAMLLKQYCKCIALHLVVYFPTDTGIERLDVYNELKKILNLETGLWTNKTQKRGVCFEMWDPPQSNM